MTGSIPSSPSFVSLQTRIMQPPQDDLYAVMADVLPEMIAEGTIVFVTSKVVAIHQGRCVQIPDDEAAAHTLKKQLIRDEAERYLDERVFPNTYDITIATKYHALFPAAGIDASNSDGYYVMLPTDPYGMAWEIRAWLRERYSLTNVGVVISDSHTMPMRRGVVGVSIGFAGFEPLYDCRGHKDLFGRALETTQVNYVDAYTAMANVYMGEGSECTPIVLAHNLPYLRWCEQYDEQDFVLDSATDIYGHMFRDFVDGGAIGDGAGVSS